MSRVIVPPRPFLAVLSGLLLVRPAVGNGAFAQLAAARTAALGEASAAGAPRVLVLSDQARRFLTLQYRVFPTEFIGCMIGEIRGPVALVYRIAPADVEPSYSTATGVTPTQTCEAAGWAGTVGMIHSHPAAERCWYYFPGTQVLSADAESFLHTGYPLDAIMCGDRVVWIARDMAEQQVALADRGRGPHVAAGR